MISNLRAGMIPHLESFDLPEWIKSTRNNPEVRFRTIWENSDFWAFLTRGPNSRKEFHINPFDEIFFQIEGEVDLYYMKPDGRHALTILKPGELFLMPTPVPHSARRGEGSWTYLVERKRGPDTTERWIWYCDNCDGQLYEVSEPSGGQAAVVAEGLAALREDSKLRTCSRCAHLSEF